MLRVNRYREYSEIILGERLSLYWGWLDDRYRGFGLSIGHPYVVGDDARIEIAWRGGVDND